MPVYEYKCKKCEHKFEKMVPMSDSDKLPPCDKCSSNETEKQISLGSFLLKGSGWFKDGY